MEGKTDYSPIWDGGLSKPQMRIFKIRSWEDARYRSRYGGRQFPHYTSKDPIIIGGWDRSAPKGCVMRPYKGSPYAGRQTPVPYLSKEEISEARIEHVERVSKYMKKKEEQERKRKEELIRRSNDLKEGVDRQLEEVGLSSDDPILEDLLDEIQTCGVAKFVRWIGI